VARLDDLETLRTDLRAWLDEAPVDRRAALVAQYRATLAEIESLAPPEQKSGDLLDEIAARRAARGGATARTRRATGH
jgi:hypothetical protein